MEQPRLEHSSPWLQTSNYLPEPWHGPQSCHLETGVQMYYSSVCVCVCAEQQNVQYIIIFTINSTVLLAQDPDWIRCIWNIIWIQMPCVLGQIRFKHHIHLHSFTTD